MTAMINTINSIVWSSALVYLCLGAGLYFSVRTGFLQLRRIREMIRLLFQSSEDDHGVSSF
ncbi:MAG: sodium:alanine symporter, partial [Duodenibacillus sp.]